MDINAVLHFISSQIEKIIGVIAALFIATTALLIFRSIKEEKNEHGGSAGGADAASIEDALRRVLSQTSVTTRTEGPHDLAAQSHASVVAGSGGADPEKDERIATLQAALQKAQTLLKERMETGATPSAAPAADGGAADAQLQKEVDELRARLSEYEIIEDDIADLAMFKEENARLKQEVDTLKTSGPATAPAVAETAEPAAIKAEPVQAEEEAPSQVDDPFAALMDEAKKQQDLAAELIVEHAIEPEPIASGEPGTGVHDPADTEKMAIEAQALADAALKSLADDNDGVEVLSNLVDTDKLIDEVNALDAEDLMSEFKDKGKS